MSAQSDTLTAWDGTDVEVEHLKALADGRARFDVTAEDGRRWQLDVDRDAEVEVVTSWRDGKLADVDVPDWMDEIVTRIAQ